MKTTRTSTALCALTLCALSACQTAKPAPDILTLPQPAVDAHVKALLLDPNPGFVLRGRMGAWTELAPTLDLLAQNVPDGKLAGLLQELGSGGAVAAFEGLFSENRPADLPDLALVKREGTGWLRVSVVASDQTWGLLDLGVGLVSPYEPLEFWTVEALLPSSDPAKLAEQLDVGELQAEVAGPYVRVWKSHGVYGFGDSERVEVKTIDQERRGWRMTPALARFLSEDAPGALYIRGRDARLLAMAHGITQMMDVLQNISPDYVQKLVARGTSITLNVLALAPSSLAEFEDHALILGGDAEAAGAFVDAVSTRTAFGREVQAAGARADVSLPTFSGEAMPADSVVVDASYNFDLASADDLYEAPLREILGDLGDGARLMRMLPEVVSTTGPLGMLSVLASAPSYVAALVSNTLPAEVMGAARPIAARVRVVQSSAGAFPAPFGGAAAVYFSGNTATLKARIDELPSSLPAPVTRALTLAFTPDEGGDGGVLTATFNLSGEAFGPAAPIGSAWGELTFDAATLGNLSTEARMLGALGKVRVQALPGATTSFARVSLSKDPLGKVPTVRYDFTAATNPDPCVDHINQVVIDTFTVLDVTPPDQRAQAFGYYKEEVDACAAKVESPYWDIARSRGDIYTMFFGADYDTALAAYSRACAEVGDEAACIGKAHLERVGPPAPPMDDVAPSPDY